MNEIEKFWHDANEASELFSRVPAAFPLKRDIASLKARWKAKDPNVCRINFDEENGGTTYELQFTKDQRTQLRKAYLDHRQSPKAVAGDPYFIKNMESDARVFVAIIEDWAKAIDDFESMTPESQKIRKRTLESIILSITKLDQSLAELDSSALGYWYANVVDALVVSGLQLSEADNRMASMLNHPLRAQVEAGELRQNLRFIISVIVSATSTASENLPKYSHTENDPRLRTAKALERLIIENQIPFDSSETGFSAICLRAMFDLAGADVEKMSYWLKKAEDDPDSFARFLQRMRDKYKD